MKFYRNLFVIFSLLFSCQSFASDSVREKLIAEELRLEDLGDFSGAADVGKKILRINPKDSQTLNVIAGLYGKLGRYEDEVIWAKKAISIDKNFYLAHNNLGNALFYLGKLDDARNSFETARTLSPRDPLPVYSLGTLAEERHDLSMAIAYFERSIELDPKFEPGMFSLAAMYANAKKYDAAIATLDKLLLLNPRAQDAIEMRNQIETAMSQAK